MSRHIVILVLCAAVCLATARAGETKLDKIGDKWRQKRLERLQAKMNKADFIPTDEMGPPLAAIAAAGAASSALGGGLFGGKGAKTAAAFPPPPDYRPGVCLGEDWEGCVCLYRETVIWGLRCGGLRGGVRRSVRVWRGTRSCAALGGAERRG
jgi:hypothetical protein